MAWTYLVDFSIANLRVRIAKIDSGYVMTKVVPGDIQGSRKIRRTRFAQADAATIGFQCLSAALEAVEPMVLELRAAAESASRRAITAKRTMRAGSQIVRQLERDCVLSTEVYLRDGRSLAMECARVEQLLDTSGFPTGVRPPPLWMELLLKTEAAVT